jgi:hypothetical protein
MAAAYAVGVVRGHDARDLVGGHHINDGSFQNDHRDVIAAGLDESQAEGIAQ